MNAKETMLKKLNILKKLGVDKKYLKMYCDEKRLKELDLNESEINYNGKELISSLNSIIKKSIVRNGTYFLYKSYLTSSRYCPFCHCNATCETCSFGKEFGICTEENSSYIKSLNYLTAKFD
jgi:hypothetical protein